MLKSRIAKFTILKLASNERYVRDDPSLKQFLIDPSTNALFELARDGVLLCKLINVAVPNTIDEHAINTKQVFNLC
ncbi:hypothetical protein QVD17_11399 [Tagetes erecta]|uniref:Calponin-homology (CH) domain-containing protein n=1 Tax=Tagetes erecta TaxID=13708 RepID=A0AAD8KTD5_TARER|nr:hypothetical protein QVD17_11399 [Tagetes erecta]